MNKKLHLFLFCLVLIFIVCSCKDKLFNLIEPFQVIITPDNKTFNPIKTKYSVLTYDTDLGSGYTQASICSDDSAWRMGEKTCRDYSLSGSNCEDIGDDGRLAFDACKVACDNCNTYTEVKRRLRNPSPMEERDEPSYAQFEGGEGGDFGSIGGVDIREILGKLDDLKSKMDLIILDGGGGGGDGDGDGDGDGGGGGGGDENPVDPSLPSPEPEPSEGVSDPAPSVKTGYCSGNTNTTSEPDILCLPIDSYTNNPNNSTIKSRVPEDCCFTKGWCKGNTDPNSDYETICQNGYTDKIGKISLRGTTPEECCNKTGFCSGNDDSSNDFSCTGSYTLKPNSNTIVGSGIPTCCDREQETAPEPIPEPPPETEPKTWNIIKIILIILAVLILLIFIGVIVNYYFEYKKINSSGRSDLTESLL